MPMTPVHHMAHQADRPNGGVEWGCPRCGRYMVFYPLRHIVLVLGEPNIVHLSGKGFPPPPDRVPILSEFDEHWLRSHEMAWDP
jgi:hypothetical protein